MTTEVEISVSKTGALGSPTCALPRLLVLGGGFAGATLAIHLLRAAVQAVEIVVVEPREELGHGLAYGTDDPEHRINVPSDKMFIFSDDPSHFTRWLEDSGQRSADPEGETSAGWHYSRRRVFGAYMQETLSDALASAPAGSRLAHLKTRAVDLDPGRAGAWAQVDLETGETVAADVVVFAASHERPLFPWPLDAATRRAPGLITDPWVLGPLQALPRDSRVLIVGTGLTMVDVAAGLLSRGHRGPLLAVSRRGQLPQPHGPFEPMLDVLASDGVPQTALQGLRLVRQLAREQAQAGRSWHLAVDGARRAAETIWRAWTPAEQAKALRRLRPFWDTHRYRIAPQLQERIARARAAGALEIRTARVLGISHDAGEFEVKLQERGSPTATRQRCDAVINCMGPSPDVTQTRNPLIRKALGRGLARPDPHRLGLDVDAAFRLRDRRGEAQPKLRAVGPLTRGCFWEVVGVPELSTQCKRLAEVLLAEMELNDGRPGRPAALTLSA